MQLALKASASKACTAGELAGSLNELQHKGGGRRLSGLSTSMHATQPMPVNMQTGCFAMFCMHQAQQAGWASLISRSTASTAGTKHHAALYLHSLCMYPLSRGTCNHHVMMSRHADVITSEAWPCAARRPHSLVLAAWASVKALSSAS